MLEKTLSSEEFDRKFDAGDDLSNYIDWSKAKRPGREDLAATIRQLHATRQRLLEEVQRIEETLTALHQANV
jgi:hypothetical protein